ncbi:unnamed protein product [Mytilus coruscus]|uniref:WSC domain-containing protein n=1 Tax=Mytilus coruscus TaxID=42192 RepID=A0A6J8BT60_MYTCO|nr:unnamed protein product [Mytilus coruscus]
MGFMNNLLCLPLFVLIFIFDSVINSKGEKVQLYSTKTKYTWFQVRNECSLIRNESTYIDIPTFNSDLRWTGDNARYLPWVEYLGCFGFEERQLVAGSRNVEQGKQLNECLMHCKQYNFIGLQQSKCVCLHDLILSNHYLKFQCNTVPEQCQGDEDAFCGTKKSGDSSIAFSLYQKVNVTERVDDGNCLAVDKKNDSINYVARDCSATAFQICLKGELVYLHLNK